MFRNIKNGNSQKEFQTLQREDAGWINKKTNTLLMQNLSWPDINESYVDKIYNKVKTEFFEKSIYLSINLSFLDDFLKSLLKNQLPDFCCDFSANSKMLCWYHPALKIIEEGVLLSFNQNENPLVGEITTNKQDNEFEQLRKIIFSSKFEVVALDFKTAKLVSAISEKNIIPDKKKE